METYDYIVVGSGSAGSVIAARLGEDPTAKILVIEAGGKDGSYLFRRPGALAIVYQVPKLKEPVDWGYKTTPQKNIDNRKMPWTRGKIVGGCSTVNGMLYVRGHRDNYDEWRNLGCDGWGYDDVLPYFKRSEGHEDGTSEFHGGEGPLRVTRQQGISPVSEAFKEAIAKVCGVPILDDFNGAVQECASTYQMTCADRLRSSTSVAFLHPAVERGNVALIVNAMVTKVVIDNGRATGVCVRHEGVDKTIHASKEVILAAGAIGSPQLLLLSGIGPAAHLRDVGIDVVADVPGVGENLHDHLLVPVRFLATKETGHRSTAPHFISGMLMDAFFGKGWFGKTFLEGGAFVKSSEDQPRPDIQFMSIPWAYPEPNDDEDQDPTISKKHSFTVLPGLIYPKSRGTVRLASGDPSRSPLIDPNYLDRDEDMQVLLRGLQLTREFARTEPLAQYIRGEANPGPEAKDDDALRAHVRLSSKTIYHPVGTCKMGVDDAAVVDSQLRVRGIDGLRVADASIMPTIVGGNTNAPTIMIGEKAADLIRATA